MKDINNDGKDEIACHEPGGNNTMAVAVVIRKLKHHGKSFAPHKNSVGVYFSNKYSDTSKYDLIEFLAVDLLCFYAEIFIPTAPTVNFVQVDWSSEERWHKKFCVNKELYAVDANGDNKYVKLY